MERNKDEALRAKRIAERMFAGGDVDAARRMAAKAVDLYPELDGLPQFQAVLDVHSISRNKIGGMDSNWPRILQVDRDANEATIRKHYRRLILLLHPDKNKLPGAETAFKLVIEAWRAASLQSHRCHSSDTFAGFFGSQQTASSKIDTFWTKCPSCNTKCQQLQSCFSRELVCRNCNIVFVAEKCKVDINNHSREQTPFNVSGKEAGLERDKKENKLPAEDDSNVPTIGATEQEQNVSEEQMAREWQYISTKATRRQALARLLAKKSRSKVKMDAVAVQSSLKEKPNDSRSASNHSRKRPAIDVVTTPSEMHPLEIAAKTREMLEDKSGKKEEGASRMTERSEREDKGRHKEDGFVRQTNISHDPEMICKEDCDLIDVPDSEFYEFDKERREDKFDEGQIWAIYDDNDGMPRYYGRIMRVICRQPFKVEMVWLEKEKCSSNCNQSCGVFKTIDKVIVSVHVDIFSHLVTWEEGNDGEIKIYPRKGEIWALYKREMALAEAASVSGKGSKEEYDLVQALTNYSEDLGVVVMPLKKVEGFKAVFLKQKKGVHCLVKEKLVRFSHQIMAYCLDEREDLPKDYIELDPASTPILTLWCSHGVLFSD